MPFLYKYIFKKLFASFAIVLLFLLVLIWSNEMFNRSEVIIFQYNARIDKFLYMSLLFIPRIISNILPFAILFSVCFTIINFRNNSELAIMINSGYSKIDFANPFLHFIIIISIINFFNISYLTPISYKDIKDKSFELSQNVSRKIGKAKEFITVDNEYLFYAENVIDGNKVNGLLIQKIDPDPTKEQTFIARQGLIEDNENIDFFMKDGLIISQNSLLGKNSIISFDEIKVTLDTTNAKRNNRINIGEFTLNDLFNGEKINPEAGFSKEKLLAEAHNRITDGLYNIVIILAVIRILLTNINARTSSTYTVIHASSFFVVIKSISLFFTTLSESNIIYNFMHYLTVTILFAFAFIPIRKYLLQFIASSKKGTA